MRFKRLVATTVAVVLMSAAVPANAISLKRIQAVDFVDANTGYMGGGYLGAGTSAGFLSVTTDGGSTWRATPFANRWFVGVGAASSGGWALDDYYDFAFNSANTGLTWETKGPIAARENVSYSDIAELSGGRMVAVGRRTSTVSGNGQPTGDLAVIASSTNGGVTWSTDYEGPTYDLGNGDWGTTKSEMVAVDATSSGSVAWAVGTERESSSGANWLIYKTATGGSTWVKQTAPAYNGSPLTCVTAASSNVAFAGAINRSLLRTLNGGTTWTNTAFPKQFTPSASMYANGIAAVNDNTVVAVGGNGSSDGAALIGVSKNASAATPTWTYTILSAAATLRDVSILTPTTWLAVGDDETIYRTTNAGTTWTAVSPGLTNPVITIGSPATDFSMSGPVTISGTASDVGVGVAGVAIKIARPDGSTWSGSAWTATESWLPATSDDGFANWSLGWTPDSAAISGGSVTISARATDGMGLTKTASRTSTDSRVATWITSSSKSAYLAFRGTGTLSGYLNSGSGGVEGQKIELQSSSNGTTFSGTGITETTSGSGYFRFDLKPSIRTYYRVKYDGGLGLLAADPTYRICLIPKVYLSKKPWERSKRTTVYHGKYYYYYSSLNPRHTAGSRSKMYFQRYYNGKYRAYKTVYAYSYNYSYYSRIRAKYKIPYKGKWRVRAYHYDYGHAKTYSGWLYLTVK